MKVNYIVCALIALLAISCTKEEQRPLQTEQTRALVVSASVEHPDGGTKTTLEGRNVKWTVGDKIYLTDGTNYSIYEATTNETTTSFEYVSGEGTFSEGAAVYAYYPADKLGDTPFDNGSKAFTATIPSVQPYTAGGFSDGINPMTAKATVSNGALALSFKNVMAFVKLQIADSSKVEKILKSLSLSSPSANLSGTATVTVADDGTAAASIATGTGSNRVEVTGIDATLSLIASPVYIAVPASELGNLTITAGTSESEVEYTQTKTASSALTPARSSINSYNPMQISSFTNKYKKGTNLPANCYMIDITSQQSIVIPLSQAEAGWNAIKTLEPSDAFDKSKITSGDRTINVRWKDSATGEITLSSIDAVYMKLDFADCSNGSNAVVDLKNGEEIVWSWHLWFTDYKPSATAAEGGKVHTYPGPAFQSGGLYFGKVMMDRNLGATVIGVSDTIKQPTTSTIARKYMGLYYQFGRKDPFAVSDSVGKRHNIINGYKTYAQAALEPDTFYYGKSDTTSWCLTDNISSKMTDPWNSKDDTKSAFDPCPAGWRIPDNDTSAVRNVWSGLDFSFWKTGNKRSGLQWNNVWLPAAGCIETSTAKPIYQGQRVFYWAASPRLKGSGYYMYFYRASSSSVTEDIARTDRGARTFGLPIRCVSE